MNDKWSDHWLKVLVANSSSWFGSCSLERVIMCVVHPWHLHTQLILTFHFLEWLENLPGAVVLLVCFARVLEYPDHSWL